MPSYTLKDLKTLDTWDIICSWDELQTILNEMPNVQQVPSAPKIVSGVGGVHSRTSDGFKDLLKTIKKGAGRNNTINT